MFFQQTLISFSHAQNQAKDQWQVEHDHIALDVMVNSSSKPSAEVKRQLLWSQVFALAGGLAVVTCNNYRAYDIDVWMAAAVYFTAQSLILKHKEKKIAEIVIESHKQEVTQSDMKNARSKQVKSLDEILGVQRQAIELIKKQNQLLKNMRTIYYSTFGLLLTLLILSKTVGPSIGITDESLRCSLSGNKNKTFSALSSKIMKIVQDYYGVLGMVLTGFSLIKKVTNLKINTELDKELNEELKVFSAERIIWEKLLSLVGNIGIISNSFAQGADVSGADASPSVPDGTQTADVSSGAKKALDKIRTTLLHPYARLGLYGLMGTVTQFSLNRNKEDIKTYEDKINYFDLQVKDLKANLETGLIQDDKDSKKQNVDNLTVLADFKGCLNVDSAGTYVFDEVCNCKKSNTCIKLLKNIPKESNKEVKELYSNLDKLYNGDSSYINDEKKADALYQSSLTAASTSLEELNKLQLSKGEEPYNHKKNMQAILKSTFTKENNFVASTTSSSKTSRVNNKNLDDYSFDIGNSRVSNSRSGIHLQGHLDPDVPLNDIHESKEDSVFDVISLRYKKSAIPFYTKEQ